jgi:Reverse transcriptase (RNA-dependent DNA polymerase)
MTSKHPRARHRRFLAAGFFPPEVPPCFYSEQLAKFRNSLLRDFDKLPLVKGEPDFYFYKSNRASFNFPRFNNSDRRHSFINPIAYFFLSKTLSDSHVALRKITKKSKLSLSPSIFDWSGERALKRPIFDSRDTYLAQLNARFEYVVHSDIRAFYHSIYTHAIAWAVHTKTFAKKNRSPKHVGNLIDLLCRNSQDGQTIGLPVGPDTSRMIAEIVGSAIDCEVQRRIKLSNDSAMRFVDDFSFGCNSKQVAERTIAIVRRAAVEFELDLNNEKTTIETSSASHPGGWKNYVRSLIPKIPYGSQDIELFLYQVGKLAEVEAGINIEKFAIQNARRMFVECPDWKRIEQYLISTYRRNSTVIGNLVEIFILRQSTKHDLGISNIRDLVESRLPALCEQQKNGEAVWLLFLVITLKLEISAKCLRSFFDEDDPLVALLVADAVAKGLVQGSVSFVRWNKSLTLEGLDGPMWLYAYETTLKSINNFSKTSHVTGHRYFRQLYDKKIEFYRSGEGIYSISSVMKKRKKENADVAKLLGIFDVDLNFDVDEIDNEEFFDSEDDSY